MGSYQLTRRTRLLAQKTRLEAAITALEALYTSAIANIEVESYKFDSGEGSQQTKRRDPNKILEQIDKLEARLSHVINELAGIGVINVQLRRTRGGDAGRGGYSY
jgi:hypothetical protein